MVQAGVMGAIALVVLLVFRAPRMALVVCGLAAFVLASGLWAPAVFLGIDRGMQAFGRFVGHALSWILLTPFFYLFCVPARVLLRLRGIDPMTRGFPGQAGTYWTAHKVRRGPNDYRKQY